MHTFTPISPVLLGRRVCSTVAYVVVYVGMLLFICRFLFESACCADEFHFTWLDLDLSDGRMIGKNE